MRLALMLVSKALTGAVMAQAVALGMGQPVVLAAQQVLVRGGSLDTNGAAGGRLARRERQDKLGHPASHRVGGSQGIGAATAMRRALLWMSQGSITPGDH